MLATALITVGISLLCAIAKIIIEELVLDEAGFIEWITYPILLVGYYLALQKNHTHPSLCLVTSLAMAASLFGISRLAHWVASEFFAWGEDGAHLDGILFLGTMPILLLLLFIPTGLPKIIGFPDLFHGQMNLFLIVVATETIILGLYFACWYYMELSNLSIWAIRIINTILLIALAGWAFDRMPSRTQALILSNILILTATLQMTAVLYLASFWEESFLSEENFLSHQLATLLTQSSILLIIYLVPVIAKILPS